MSGGAVLLLADFARAMRCPADQSFMRLPGQPARGTHVAPYFHGTDLGVCCYECGSEFGVCCYECGTMLGVCCYGVWY
eukprot:518191-Rhodomonas_salina.1